MTLPQQDPVRGKCLLCNADNHELFTYLGECCVCQPCLQTVHGLAKLSGQNAEAAKWLAVAETYVKKQRVENAPCLEYARKHWRDALCAANEDEDDDDDEEEGYSCADCRHYNYDDETDEEDCTQVAGEEYLFTARASRECPSFKKLKGI